MDLNELPDSNNYQHMDKKQIKHILIEYEYDYLLESASKGNAKAQHACLIMIEFGMLEYEGCDILTRLGGLQKLWELSKQYHKEYNCINESTIGLAVKEIIMGKCMYDHTARPPSYRQLCLGIDMIKNTIETKDKREYHIAELLRSYELYRTKSVFAVIDISGSPRVISVHKTLEDAHEEIDNLIALSENRKATIWSRYEIRVVYNIDFDRKIYIICNGNRFIFDRTRFLTNSLSEWEKETGNNSKMMGDISFYTVDTKT
jgi:hypothetical protein